MQPVRLIPRLDVEGANLVRLEPQGVRRILGSADAFIRHYAEAGASALWLVDWQARSWGRSLLHERLARGAPLGVPLVVSGAVLRLADVDALLAAGASRVALGAEAIEQPDLLSDALARFGAEEIAVSIDVRRHADGHHELLADGGTRPAGVAAVDWVRRAAELGGTELFATSCDRDGTAAGYDLELASALAEAADAMHVTLCGGAGSVEHVLELFKRTGVTGASLASLVHFEAAPRVAHRSDWSGQAVLQFLRESGALRPFRLASVREIKQRLAQAQIPCAELAVPA